jgi:anti-anti-sigma factor
LDVSDRGPPFSIVVEADNGKPRLVLSGEIDLAAVPEFFERLQDADRMGGRRISLDMHLVTLIDSSGLGVIARLAAAGVTLEIHGATGVVLRALEISGLGRSDNVTIY